MINADAIVIGYDFWIGCDNTSPKYGTLVENIFIVDDEIFSLIKKYDGKIIHKDDPNFEYLIFNVKSYMEYLEDFNFADSSLQYGEQFWRELLIERINMLKDIEKIRFEFQDNSIATMIRMML